MIDEFIGQCIPLSSILFRPENFIPNCCKNAVGHAFWDVWVIWILLSFVTFRFFDILKPSIIYRVQKLGYGVGIMMDDVISGVLSLLIVMGLFY